MSDAEFTPETSDPELTRRSFISKVGAGLASLIVLEPVAGAAQLVADTPTRVRALEEHYRRIRESECLLDPQTSEFDCAEPEQPTLPKQTSPSTFTALAVAPMLEEAAFRVAPSRVMDKLVGENAGDSEQILGMSGAEWAAGVADAVVFGVSHNIVSGKGFGLNRIPANQTILGLGYWRLQRTKGYAANVAAHTGNNLIAMFSFGRKSK